MKLSGHINTFINTISLACRSITLINIFFFRYIRILASHFGLWLSLDQFNARYSSMYRKAEQIHIKYFNAYYVDVEISKCNVHCDFKYNWNLCTVLAGLCEIIRSNWYVFRCWCNRNEGLTPPHSLLLSKFSLLPSGWPEQWWTALWSSTMTMKKLPHLHPRPILTLRTASQRHLWRISCRLQHTSPSLRSPLRRRMCMSCRRRIKNCLQRYVS